MVGQWRTVLELVYDLGVAEQDLIRNYGLFWRVDSVFWGRGSNAGALLGRPVTARTSDPIDFRKQIAIYALFAGYSLIYVGQTGSGDTRLFDRLKQHKNGPLSGRWDRFSWFGIRKVNKDGALGSENLAAHASIETVLDHIEAVLIATSEPPLNRRGGDFGSDVAQYVQHRDRRLGLTDSQMLRRLSNHAGLTNLDGADDD